MSEPDLPAMTIDAGAMAAPTSRSHYPSYVGTIGATPMVRADGRPVVFIRMGDNVECFFAEGAEHFAEMILEGVRKSRETALRLAADPVAP